MNTTTNTQAVSVQLADLMDDLSGFHPALDTLLASVAGLLSADLTADQSQSVIAALGGAEAGNVLTLLALTVRQIGNPDANPALAGLPVDRQQTLRRLGAEYAAAVDDPEQQQLAAEMSAVIDGV